VKALALALLVSAPALAQTRVEPRLLIKERHLFLSGGVTWLERGDYYDSPGLIAQISWYPVEQHALELQLGGLFSFMSTSGQEVFRVAGLVPDAHMPAGFVLAGWRHTLAYGKAAIGAQIVHFDLQGAAHVGTLITDRAWTPALSFSGGVLVRLSERVFAQLDLGLLANYESRPKSSPLNFGFLPLLTLGAEL
jgi:hypothetical protein